MDPHRGAFTSSFDATKADDDQVMRSARRAGPLNYTDSRLITGQGWADYLNERLLRFPTRFGGKAARRKKRPLLNLKCRQVSSSFPSAQNATLWYTVQYSTVWYSTSVSVYNVNAVLDGGRARNYPKHNKMYITCVPRN